MANVNDLVYWLDEITEAEKREEKFRNTGDRVLGIYECKDEERVPFNILYSNTETLLPALYSAVPRPVVQRRWRGDEDQMAKAAATAGTRMLEYLIDTNYDGYESFGDALQNAVIDALLPGRGITAIKYDAEINETNEENEDDDDITDNAGNHDDDTEKEPIEASEGADETRQAPLLTKASELICPDSKCWDKALFGYAKKWSDMPWIAFEEVIDHAEAERMFGAEIAAKIQFTTNNEDGDNDGQNSDEKHQGGRRTATIYQIWDRSGGRKVRYVSQHYKDDFLKVEDDPLELTGFFPIPRPLQFLASSNNTAIAPYNFYETQAREVNTLTKRINRIASAIKAKGIYDAELGGDIENLMDGDDNALIPADKTSALAAQNGFQNAIWFMPIDMLTAVLAQLYQAREQCKQVIYEITGISDIIRGSTVASETATAQNIKSQWGTMRLKRLQGEVQRYARDMLRIMLEMAATKFSEATWAAMTGLPYATSDQVQQAQMIMQAAAQQQPQQPPMPGPDGQPQTPQISPIVQQAQQVMQGPKWSEVLQLLKSDMDRSYRIDIETNSTVLPQLQEDQQNLNEAMTALGQYLQGVTPLVQAGSMPFEVAKTMLMTFVRRYQFGSEIEDFIKQMQPPKPPEQPPQPVDNTLQVKQMEMQGQQAELQAQQQIEVAKAAANHQTEQAKAEAQYRIKEMEIKAEMEIEKYKADLDAQVRLQIAGINAIKSEEVLCQTQ